jgi:hypothetical protein
MRGYGSTSNDFINGFGNTDAFKSQGDILFVPGKRRRVNVLPILLNLLGPSVIFAVVFIVLSFKAHYRSAELTWIFIALVFVGVLCMYWYTYRTHRNMDREGDWNLFAAHASMISVILATIAGATNYDMNLRPFYTVENLNTYASANPATQWGQQFMDAGKMYFADGSNLDMKKAASFMNADLYCVVPIVNGDEKMDHYDFWAVGTNCCNPNSADFRCGQFNNPYARSGLRVFWPNDLSFYRLAVEMAEKTYGISAPHPIFVTWVQDPVAELNAYSKTGFKMFLICTTCHFSFNLLCVMTAVVFFSKIGYLQSNKDLILDT